MKIIILFIAFISSAYAGGCDSFYPHGNQINIPHSVELCNSFYVVEFDTELNAPIFSAEKFRSQTTHIERLNDFHPDLRLQSGVRAERSDYLKSGFDQGHMTPAADAITDAEMHDTFLLSNMTPQQPTLNRQSWRLLEIKVRQMVPEYILTGAMYDPHPPVLGDHHVPIPSGYYKVIWKGDTVQAWFADNVEHAPVVGILLNDLNKRTGLDLK